MNQAEFFQANAVDGVLPQEKMGQMLALPEGETVFTTESGQPEPAATPAPAPAPADPPAATPAPAPAEPPAPTPEPVITAKDGVHTIPYSKLEEARNAANVAKAEAERLAAENEALKKAQVAAPAPSPAPTNAPAPAADKVDFGDFSDEAVAKGIEEAVEKRVNARIDAAVNEKLAPLQKQANEQAVRSHFEPIYKAHPNMDSILESSEFAEWQKAQPSFTQAAIADVLTKGTAPQVIELFDSFKKATEKAPPPAPAASQAPAPADAAAAAAAKAAEAVAKAKNDPPSSLSEIPGGAGAVDEATAMLEMSPTALLTKFMGKSPEEIHKALSKVI